MVPTRHVGATRWVTVAALCWHLFVLREHVLLHASKCCLEVVVVYGSSRPCRLSRNTIVALFLTFIKVFSVGFSTWSLYVAYPSGSERVWIIGYEGVGVSNSPPRPWVVPGRGSAQILRVPSPAANNSAASACSDGLFMLVLTLTIYNRWWGLCRRGEGGRKGC